MSCSQGCLCGSFVSWLLFTSVFLHLANIEYRVSVVAEYKCNCPKCQPRVNFSRGEVIFIGEVILQNNMTVRE